MTAITYSKALEIDHYSAEEIIAALLSTSSSMNLAVACWRLPNQDNFSVLIDFSKEIIKVKAQPELSSPGFYIQPFIQDKLNETYFLKADLLFCAASKSIHLRSELSNPIEQELFLENFIAQLSSKSFPFNFTDGGKVQFGSSSEYYQEMVELAKIEIKNETFKKVVLARKKELPLHDKVEIVPTLLKIHQEFPASFISFVSTNVFGSWLTATPETLVTIDDKGIFKTVALAATQPLKEFEKLQRAVWTQKEIEEQALVARYIVNCFKKIRLREYEEQGPRTIKSGHLLHLITEFSVNTKAVNFSELGTVMLELLHPTSAVCGMPKETALGFIQDNEKLDRMLFSGYLGPVNINGQTNLFVNLRCAKIFDNKAVLFAGAGITQDSEAEKEFLETELKMKAIGQFFNPPH